MRDLLDLLLVQARDVDLVGGGDDVSGVDASQGNAVDLEGAGDEQNTLVEGLEEDDALAAEAAGEKDQDGAGLERLPGRPGADGLADLRGELVSETDSEALVGLISGSCARRPARSCRQLLFDARVFVALLIRRPAAILRVAGDTCGSLIATSCPCIRVAQAHPHIHTHNMTGLKCIGNVPSWSRCHPRGCTTSSPCPQRRGPPGSTCRTSWSEASPTW